MEDASQTDKSKVSSTILTAESVTAAKNSNEISQYFDKDGNKISANALNNYFSVSSGGINQANGAEGLVTTETEVGVANQATLNSKTATGDVTLTYDGEKWSDGTSDYTEADLQSAFGLDTSALSGAVKDDTMTLTRSKEISLSGTGVGNTTGIAGTSTSGSAATDAANALTSPLTVTYFANSAESTVANANDYDLTGVSSGTVTKEHTFTYTAASASAAGGAHGQYSFDGVADSAEAQAMAADATLTYTSASATDTNSGWDFAAASIGTNANAADLTADTTYTYHASTATKGASTGSFAVTDNTDSTEAIQKKVDTLNFDAAGNALLTAKTFDDAGAVTEWTDGVNTIAHSDLDSLYGIEVDDASKVNAGDTIVVSRANWTSSDTSDTQ